MRLVFKATLLVLACIAATFMVVEAVRDHYSAPSHNASYLPNTGSCIISMDNPHPEVDLQWCVGVHSKVSK